MARAIWTGAVTFGLVNVPVGLFSATEQHEVRFHQFQKGTSSRIRYRRVNEDTGEEVPYDEIVKGAEVDGGEYVVLTREELEQVEPGRSRTIEISDFVDAAEIDPIHFQKSYYLAPREEAAGKAYALLARAMEDAGRVGVATFVMRSKEYLAAVRPRDGVLVLETMYFADEVRDAEEEIDALPVEASPQSKELEAAVGLIEAMTVPWEPERYRDTFTERVEELVEAKSGGEEVVTESRTVPEGKVVDLQSALQESIDKARGGDGDAGGRSRRSASEQLEDMTKSELYERARDLDVPGRSSMGRDELLDAVRRAGGPGERRAAS